MVYRSSFNNTYYSYLKYLEKKEKRIIFSFKNKLISHGKLASYFRFFKGLILGFGLGNLLIQRSKEYPLAYYLVFLTLFFVFSVLLINYEKRSYKRKGLTNSIKVGLLILFICFLFSLIVLIYSNYKNLIVILTITMFFSSLTYSME